MCGNRLNRKPCSLSNFVHCPLDVVTDSTYNQLFIGTTHFLFYYSYAYNWIMGFETFSKDYFILPPSAIGFVCSGDDLVSENHLLLPPSCNHLISFFRRDLNVVVCFKICFNLMSIFLLFPLHWMGKMHFFCCILCDIW